MPAAATGLVRDSLVYAGGLALQRGLSVLVLPAATRILEPAELGVASASLAVAGVLSMVFSFGFNYGIVRLYYDEPADAERTEWAALLRVQLLAAAGLAGAAWLLGPAWSGMFENVPWSRPLQAAVLLAVLQSAQSTTLGVLRAGRRIGAFSAVVVAQVGLGATLAIALAHRHGAGGLIEGLAAGAAAGAVVGTILTWRRPKWSLTAVRAGLLFSAPFVAHMLSSWVLSLSDRVLIERFLDLERLGEYHLAYAVASLPILVTDAVQAAWLPRYYGLPDDEKRDLPVRVAPVATLVVVGVAAGVVALAPAIERLVAPPTFDFPLVVVALVVSMTFVRTPYLLGFAVLSDTRQGPAIARASALAAAVNLALNLWFIPVWGLTGAAASTLIAYAVMSLVVVNRAERTLGRSFDVGRLVAVWAAGVALVLALAHLAEPFAR